MQYFCHALKLNFKEPTLSRKCKPLFDDSQVARTKDDYKFSTAKDPLFNSTGFCKVEDHCRQEHRCDCRKSEVRSGKWEMGGQKSKHGSKKWEVGGQKSKHAALSLNGQKSEIRSSNFVKSEVWSLKYEVLGLKSEVWSLKSEVGSQKLEVGSRKSEVGSQKSENPPRFSLRCPSNACSLVLGLKFLNCNLKIARKGVGSVVSVVQPSMLIKMLWCLMILYATLKWAR